MKYAEAVAYLNAHIGVGMKPGLARMEALLELMGHPEEGYPIVHIAGTNGKTSTARIITQVLAGHDLSVGTYTSPHLERVEERIGINGRFATPDEFAQAVTDVAAFADIFESRGDDKLSYFELTTATAFAWFAEIAADVGVVEVGLGGRLDATNAARGEVAVVTGIDFDHTETLGDTLGAIADEKLAIAKPGSTLVTGPLPIEAEERADLKGANSGIRHLKFGRDFHLEGSESAVGGWFCQVSGVEADYDDLFLPLLGRHQTVNLTVAIAACEGLLGRALNPESLRRGLSSVTSPGRLEPVASSPLVVLDGAHNPQGFAALATALRESFSARPWLLMLGVMRDKDLDQMLKNVHGVFSGVVATTSGSARSLPTTELASRSQEILGIEAVAIDDPSLALAHARAQAGDEGAVVVAGSLYLVGTIRSLLMGRPSPDRNER